MGSLSADSRALGTRARSTCESAWLGMLHHRPAQELLPFVPWIVSRLRARDSRYVTFSMMRDAEGRDVERYRARERAEEERRIRR